MKPSKPFSRLIRQSGLYALGNVAVKLSGLLLAPFYLNPAYLPVEAYGYFALLTVTAQLGIFAVGLGIGSGLLKFLATPEDKAVRDALPFTALLTTAGAAAVAAVCFRLLEAPLAGALLDDAGSGILIRLMGLYVVLKVVGGIPLMMMRVHERAGLYALAITAEIFVLLGGVYLFLAVQQRALLGVMEAYAWSAGVSTAILVAGMLLRVPWRFRGRLVGRLIRYGLPLVMVGLAGWFLNAGDRYLLKWLSTPETIAVYEWGARISGVLNMLFVQSFQLAFAVIGLKSIGAGDLHVHRRTFRHYVIWTGWAVLGLSLLTYDATRVLVMSFGADPSYLAADDLVLPLALGFLSYGIYIVVNNVLYATEQTRLIAANVVAAAVVNAMLNVLLIPPLGGAGAALATFISFTLLAVVSAWLAERQIPIGYPWRVFVVVIGIVVVLYAVGRMTLPWGTVERVGVRLLLIAAYLPLLLATRLYTVAEIREVLALARQRWGGDDRSPNNPPS